MTGKGDKKAKNEDDVLIEAEERGDESAGLKAIQDRYSFQELMMKIQSLEEENRRLRAEKSDSSYNPKVITVSVNTKQEEVILLVDTKSAIHYPDKSIDKNFLSALPSFSLPFSRFRNGSFRAFEIPGEAMSKRINVVPDLPPLKARS